MVLIVSFLIIEKLKKGIILDRFVILMVLYMWEIWNLRWIRYVCVVYIKNVMVSIEFMGN